MTGQISTVPGNCDDMKQQSASSAPMWQVRKHPNRCFLGLHLNARAHTHIHTH